MGRLLRGYPSSVCPLFDSFYVFLQGADWDVDAGMCRNLPCAVTASLPSAGPY